MANTLFQIKKYIVDKLLSIYELREAKRLAEILLSDLLQMSFVDLISNSKTTITNVKLRKINSAVDDLLKYKPIQYVLGKTTFVDLIWKIDPSVFIPRPETEELVQWVIDENKYKKVSILDIGTGSGCIAITLAKNIKNAKITAIDISESAISIAKKNANMHNVTIEFLCLDILNNRDCKKLRNFDLIVSNPPYVTKSESEKMLPNILQYEPQNALFVEDNDALLYYRHILKFGLEKLNKSGKIYLEINEKKGKELEFLFINNGFDNVNVCKDINGKNRMLRCQLK